MFLTCKGLQLSLTYLPAELCSSHKSVPPLKNFVLDLLTSLEIWQNRLNYCLQKNRWKLVPFWKWAQDFLHHCQVFPIVMCLEESKTKVKLKHDASYAPNITRLWPTKFWKKEREERRLSLYSRLRDFPYSSFRYFALKKWKEKENIPNITSGAL